MRTLGWVVGVIGALGVSGSTLAHHGWSGYDSERAMTLTGVIQESGYENPHGYIVLEGEAGTWHVVLAPPARMGSRGLRPEALAEGTEATVEGYPHRTTPAELRAERITVGGRTVELR